MENENKAPKTGWRLNKIEIKFIKMLTVKKVKIGTEYRFGNEIVRVTKRIKNSYKEKWYYGFGSKHQKIEHRKETTFLLNNGTEVFANELSLLNGL